MSFNHTLILKAHERKHTGENPFACSQCRVHLQVHERTHIGKKPNTCFKCDKTFKVICHLKECEKSFEQKAHLQRQDRTNTGKKPFVCYKAFTEAHTVMFLKGHEVTHKGEKLFVCTLLQISNHFKCLVTFETGVWLLSYMCPFMHQQMYP